MTIRTAGSVTVPAGDPGADLPDTLEPYMWVSQITPVRMLHVTDWWRDSLHLEVAGIVRLAGTPVPAADPAGQGEASVRAHSVRASLFGQAQVAICAAEDRGYRHWRHPEIDVTGDLRTDRDSGVDLLVAECRLRMWLWRR